MRTPQAGPPRTLDFLSELVRADDGEQRIASCDSRRRTLGTSTRHWIQDRSFHPTSTSDRDIGW